MGNYVVIARLTEEMDVRFINLQKELAFQGFAVPQWPPHITIAAYENIDENVLYAWTEQYAARHHRVNIAFNSLSILPPGGEHKETAVLCLDPAHSKPLVDFYYGFHEKYEEFCTGIGAYNSIVHDSPVIHATIGIVKISEMQKAIVTILSNDIFEDAEIIALEIYTYPMKLIKRFALVQ